MTYCFDYQTANATVQLPHTAQSSKPARLGNTGPATTYRLPVLLEVDDKTHQVVMDAVRVVQRFDRDWMTKGRRRVSLSRHKFRRSVAEIAQVVRIANTTLKKRLYEFCKTPSGALALADFRTVWLEEEWTHQLRLRIYPPATTAEPTPTAGESFSKETAPPKLVLIHNPWLTTRYPRTEWMSTAPPVGAHAPMVSMCQEPTAPTHEPELRGQTRSLEARFLTQAQRAQLAILKREQETREQKEKEERARRQREAPEREADEVRQSA
ncbi:hypothetical protein ONZ51_g12729 [Trametes cubensis]|uniref:Uncharacterized protein n=1 Tax=Trametes cubensis TaxID=1111947 RepID=A0AAD7TF88_9APHY|nr:hypothetical protein ONZ51_g12729 [Trametes cubensis]